MCWSQGWRQKSAKVLSFSQIVRMLKAADMLYLLCLVGAASALYKQWIPDTNYENKTNWDKGVVPCGNDIIQFLSQRRVSVFVESTHVVKEMMLPIDGEFILNSGSGFFVLQGQEPGCGQGVMTQFKDSESLRWFDPALWQTAATLDDLQHGNFLFSVHEERVPCHYDDVVFKPTSSFRVDASSSQSSIPVKSVSVLGKTFDSKSDFVQYLSSHSGQLQFHGSSVVTTGNPGCKDPSGCDCGNTVNHQQICSTVTCSSLSCKVPLVPVGHCCGVCGAIVTIRYSTGFSLHTYRQRIHQLFLVLSKYKSIQLGLSKVLKPQMLMGITFGATPEIQVVIVDGEKGAQSEALALDILKDTHSHGPSFGISGAEFQTSSGRSSNQSGGSPGMVAGVVLGVLIIIALIIIMTVLIHKGIVKMPSLPLMPSLSSLKSEIGDLGGPLDHGFDNPMFDKPGLMPEVPSLYGTDTNHSLSMTQTGVYFVNPVFDENETDFNA